MDVERLLVSSAISSDDGIMKLVSRGITYELFSGTPAGQQCAAVYSYCVDYTRSYGRQPSLAAIQRVYPQWTMEFSPDPVEALIDEFVDSVRMRYFDAKVVELSRASADRQNWPRLDEIMLDAARELAAVIPSGESGLFSADMERRIEQYEIEANQGYRPGYNLGIPIIDEVTGGIRPGWLITQAGFSGLGKTTLGIWSALNIFEADESVLFASLEMTKAEVLEKLDTMVTHFMHRDIARRQLNTRQVEQWKDLARVYSKAKGEIIIRDRLGGCTIDRIHAEITRHKPKVAIVDYVQRMSGTRHSMAKWEGLEEITNELKTIAMDTDTAIIMISQDGRSSAEEGSTRTNMGGSISVYQAADIYIGMMQDDQMHGSGKMRVKMLKFRHGNRAEVDMMWKPATGEFGKWDDAMAFVKQPALPAP